jgi:diaminohydroxyphosphoribosylaminopyrimidine deaminase/5-amino-6-(5-phosphoribosylamino)uracil reductase
MNDEQYMASALRLARKGAGKTSPNPLVGAVIVKREMVIGRGYHRQVGGDHAEVAALKNVCKDPGGATMYVTLEPCCIQGRTPPCTDVLLRCGLRRVVVGMVDPNPRVAGRGIEILRRAGIEVQVGVREEECQILNESYTKYITAGIPFVSMKSAATLDG